MPKCERCGGHYWAGVSAGMTSGPMCSCGRNTRIPRQVPRVQPVFRPSEPSRSRERLIQTQQQRRDDKQATVRVRAGLWYYLVWLVAIALIVIPANLFYEDHFWMFVVSSVVAVALVIGAEYVKVDLRRMANSNHLGNPARNSYGNTRRTAGDPDSDVVPISDRPRSPCSKCGRLVIAGVAECVWCGHSGFTWECNACGGALVQSRIGLMYCGACRDYWK